MRVCCSATVAVMGANHAACHPPRVRNVEAVRAGEFIVLLVPAGEYRVEDCLNITRSRVVLRGEGSDRTTFYVPHSLTDLYGQSPEEVPPFGWVNNGEEMGSLCRSGVGGVSK